MSSQYPILDNRPIDQWKVAELKEELKKRKLAIRGLKDDLIKRLDEALRTERESAEKESTENDNGFDCDPKSTVGMEIAETVSICTETAKNLVEDDSDKNEKMDDIAIQASNEETSSALDKGGLQEGLVVGLNDSAKIDEGLVAHTTIVETSTSITRTMVSELPLSGKELQNSEAQENSISELQSKNDCPIDELPLSGKELEDNETKENTNLQLEEDYKDLKPQPDNKDSSQMDNESSRPQNKDLVLESSAPNDQVSEVSPVLETHVKSDSISSDCMSINEKFELKDDISADHVKIELDVKPEMVQPSSSTVIAGGGESHRMDVEEPHESKAFSGEKEDNNSTNLDSNNKIESADVGYSEKLNLDRSSGDDSMEEDVLESKQHDSKYIPEERVDMSEKSEVPIVEEESPVDVSKDDLTVDEKNLLIEKKSPPSLPAEKRKFHDQVAVGNSEPVKRQRRWNSETIKVSEPQSGIAHKESFQSTSLKRNFSRSDSTGGEDLPKERVVPASSRPSTNSLRIDHFLRPFTLKAVQELLGKTGSVTSFWMDHIKTHCYVSYATVEEAIETRNVVYNLQWPPNGGRLLVAEFVEPQEVKRRLEAPQTPTAPAAAPAPPAPPAPPALQPQPSPRQPRRELPPPPSLPPPPPLPNQPQTIERLPLPFPQPEVLDKPDTPTVTLDDLFRKTKATPRIYYLPLSDEQVVAKVAARGNGTKQ